MWGDYVGDELADFVAYLVAISWELQLHESSVVVD